jgi:hypothetical protein
MKTLLVVLLLAGGTALEAAAQGVLSAATRRTPVMRQSPQAPSTQRTEPQRGAQLSAAGARSELTAGQKLEIMEQAGVPDVVLMTPFLLSPDAPAAPAGRGILSVVHAALVTPRSLAGDPGVVHAYNRLGGEGVSSVRVTIATRAGAHYLFECQAQKRGVQVFVDDEPGAHIYNDDPITFVVEATRTGAMTIGFAGDGSTATGVWYFYGCDVTPTRP